MTRSTPLGKIARFVRGITFKPEDLCDNHSEDSVVCMRTKNVQATLDTNDLISIPSSFVRRKEQRLQEGDLLVSSANSWNLVGKACWVPELGFDATAGGFISILRCDRSAVEPRYFFRWVTSGVTQHELRNCGRQTTNISNLDFDRAKALQIPLPHKNGKPDLDEQKRIAAILDKADAIRRKRKQALDLTDDFLRSVFLDMFGDPVTNPKGWKTEELGEVSDQLTGFAFTSADYVEAGTGIRLCRGANVLPNKIDWSDRADWPEADDPSLTRYQLQEGDITIAMDRPWISSGFKIARITSRDLPALLVQRVARIRAKTPLTNEFLFSLLGTEAFSRHCKPTETTIPHISPRELRSFPVILPDPNLLKSFSLLYKLIVSKRASMTPGTENAEKLFASLQQRAFRGEL